MANARIRPDYAWTVGPPVVSGDWLTLDTNLTKALNGDGGGTWTPTSHYVIGGAGMWLTGATNTFGGTSSQIQTSNSGNKRIVLNDNDHIVLGAGHSGSARNITTNFDSGVYATPTQWDLALGPYSAFASRATGANLMVRLAVHNGATFASATFRFVVATSHGPPATLPRFRVFAMDTKGVRAALAVSGADGFLTFTPTPANAGAWFAGGAVQSFVYTASSTVIVDTSKYTYWAEVLEEDGVGAVAGNQYIDVTCAFTNIADLRPQ